MKEAGCWRVRIGIESGNEEILKFIKKGMSKEEARRVVGWADEVGLQPKTFFMLGHCPDTKETIEETIQFALSLPSKDVTVQINTPLKGTEQYTLYKKYGDLISGNPDDYSFFQPVFLPRRLTYGDLVRAQRGFYRRFYLRPIIWWRHLRHIRRLSDLRKYFRPLKLLLHLFCFSPKRKRSVN